MTPSNLQGEPVPYFARLVAIALPFAFFGGWASADVVISSAATQSMSCSVGVCVPTAADAVLNVADLEALLESGPTEVTTTGTGVQAGNIVVSDALTWTSANALTLDAYRSIKIDRPISVDGTAGLTFTTDDGGKHGALEFRKRGRVKFAHLSNALNIDGVEYTLADSIKTLASDIATRRNGNYALAGNYDAAQDGTYTTSPISVRFSGRFEGLGNAISRLSINDQYCASVGLFEELHGGTIRDLGVVKANVSSSCATVHSYFYRELVTGALVGFNAGTVAGSYSSGVVSSTESAGGLVGFVARDGMIVQSHSAASVISSVGGGLAARNLGTIMNSYATGAVNGADEADGPGRPVSHNESLIRVSFATGSVSGHEYGFSSVCGGLVAVNISRSIAPGKIENSYATGDISCNGTKAEVGGLIGKNSGTIGQSYSIGAPSGAVLGGFAGYNGEQGIMNEDYWDTTTSGTSVGVGSGDSSGVTGLTTRQLHSGLPTGFDPKIWAEKSGINNGFPYLISNPPPK
jgi:hypothetical protein